jgi:hypothetical protein
LAPESRAFESTLPLGATDLMRASEYRRYLDESAPRDAESSPSRLGALSPSLMQDLLRFEQKGRQSEVLEVLAACVRHGRDLLVHLQSGELVVPLTVFPAQRLVHCPLPIEEFLDLALSELQVLQVETAVLRPPGHRDTALVGEHQRYTPLGPVLWELALRGSREELLPEIGGMAAYRITPSLDLRSLSLSGALDAAVRRLQRHTTNLRELSDWPGLNRARATRLLNALYLQAGLMVSRTHPAATNEGWVSGGR